MQPTAQDAAALLDSLGVTRSNEGRPVRSPIDGAIIGHVPDSSIADAETRVAEAMTAFGNWREVPGPRRGELVRLLGEELRAHKDALGRLVTLECGKPLSEGLGEVQEMIDICDFAVGLSRQLYGLTIASERPGHRMSETWHPLGPVAIITAFNFPVAVWAWNAALALVCGDPVIWKPSEKTPLTALAVMALAARALARFGDAPAGLIGIVTGGAEIGAALVDHPGIALVSATGSTRMGRIVAERAAKRFARTLLELGGNNASIVTPAADRDLALRASAFGFMGTAGQRCTSLRRLFLHRSIHDAFLERMRAAAASITIGDPRDSTNLVGPLIDDAALQGMRAALDAARAMGATVSGGEVIDGLYVRPAVVAMPAHAGPALEETFAPILYVFAYDTLEEAIALQNAVPQGLSSSIFTTDMREAERFVSAAGSDCGIANVNIGTSGAEIGGAFGGEKETGGGRESGSDSWKAYMRRQTSTVNWSGALPLAQGVKFDI
ncbi:L-piperidine-6-carboxylate dehydrogenase [Sphingomonas colocasiae]|uniref:aldehyde dehydrogenase (NAD(+)) n=1 Tax=Sphingomonas colocasiae TaxID=1848973 RepID=A0ABS7PLN0_9SPHN|nr:aldehyde dehydrogenase family protein [Sphingomonas colocasiae]MBY8821372.1 aldehyde dehydrogenase family protein [Sphingomonas colocasiae]